MTNFVRTQIYEIFLVHKGMNTKLRFVLALSAASLFVFQPSARAQGDQTSTKEEREKKIAAYIEKRTKALETSLNLEYWQVFFVDSILNHDMYAMQDELNELESRRIANPDIYLATQDKWSEKMYRSMEKILDERQWKKYQKNGALRDANERKKRRDKAEKANAELKAIIGEEK